MRFLGRWFGATHSIAKGSIEQSSNGLSDLERALLGRVSQQARERDDGDERDDKVGGRSPAGKVRDERQRDGDEEDVDPAREDKVAERLDDVGRLLRSGMVVVRVGVVIPRRRRRSTPTAVGGRRRIRTGPVMLWGSARSFRRRRRGVIGMESERGRRARVVVGNLVGPVSRRFSLGEHTLATQVTWTDMICVLVLVGARPAVLCPVLPRSGPDQGRPLAVATLRLVVRCMRYPQIAQGVGRGQGRNARSNRATTSVSLRTTRVVCGLSRRTYA